MGGQPGVAGAGGGGGAPGPSTIAVQELADYQVVQRAPGGTSQVIPLRGTFTGAAIAGVQAQVVDFATGATVVVPWVTLGGTSALTYAGTITVPQGGWYKVVVRGVDAGGVELARATGQRRFGVGMNILCIGQSNMTGFGAAPYTVATGLAGLFGNDRAWKRLADPYDGGGSASDVDYDANPGASMVPALANALASYFPGLPIGFVAAARGSSPLDCAVGAPFCWGARTAANPADVSTLYGNSLAKARAAGGVEVIVMHQGETDATNMTTGTQYVTDLAALVANYRADLTGFGSLPFFMFQLGRSTTAIVDKNRTDATMQAIRVAQHDSDQPPSVYLSATSVDLDVDATDHYRKGSYDVLGQRVAAAIAYHYGAPGAPAAYRGPEIASVAYAGAARTAIDVHLRHRGGTDFAPSTGIAGFVVLDGGAAVPIASVVRKDAATITITLAAPIAGVGTVRYLYGKLATQTLPNTVHDNAALALPLEPTAQDFTLP
jgi:hypothetical protein